MKRQVKWFVVFLSVILMSGGFTSATLVKAGPVAVSKSFTANPGLEYGGWDDDWYEEDDWYDDYDDWYDDYDDYDDYDNDDDYNDDDDDDSQSTTKKKPSLNKTKATIEVGQTVNLKVKNGGKKIKWSSSDKSIAGVSEGVVTAKKIGTVTISAACANSEKTLKCKITVIKKQKTTEITQKILSLKKKYKEGTRFTNANYYFWSAINCNCYGCIAYVGMLSDTIFGKNAKVTKHHNFSKIKPGDHIRIGDYHSVMVISVDGNELTVTEGNYNSSIHWGRVITKQELNQEGFYVETRY